MAAIDTSGLPPRLAAIVADALRARERWTSTVAALSEGPLQARIAELTAQIDAGVLAIDDAARRLVGLQQTAATVDADRATAEYKAAKRDPSTDPALLAALESKFRSVHRILNAVDDVEGQLRLLDARLDAAILRATELLYAGAGAQADQAGTELGAVVDELRVLQSTLGELGA